MMIDLLLAAAALGVQPTAAPVSSELKAGANDALGGTLVRPTGPPGAAMILIPGSGPTDRDGNNPLGVKTSSYRKLAEALAKRGVTTVRIDKRGMFGSAAAGNPNQVTFADYDGDVRSWIEVTRRATGRRCVWVAGHSEGGLIAMRAAAVPGVCGIVLLATPGEKLGETIRKQLRANPANAPFLESAEAALAELEAGRKVATEGLRPALAQGLFNPATQTFVSELLRQDPPRLAAAVAKPMLIVQGGHDVQVGTANGEVLRKAAPKATYALFPAMSHVLGDGPAERTANLATYANADLQLTPGLADRIAAFVTGAK
nr:alpha/beta fold hydrolase [uncultured Sphingomonas sp.]